MTVAISANLRIFAAPDSVDRVAASYVELLNAVAANAGHSGAAARLAGIAIHCDSCDAKSARGDDARAALNLAQKAGWLHDSSNHSDLCPDCQKDQP